MSLPLPRVVADVGPGGPLVTSMKGINALNNDMLLRKINSVKAKYAPLTTQAEAASKLAYANLLGPQFVAKLLGNDSAVANLGSDRAKSLLQQITAAGSGAGNPLGQMQGGEGGGDIFSGVGQPSTNSFSGRIKNAFHALLGQTPQGNQNAMNMPPRGYDNGSNPGVSAEGPGRIDSGSPFVGRQGYKPPQGGPRRPPGGVQLEGEQWYDKNGNPVYEEDAQQAAEPSMDMELTKAAPTYAENTGKYKGTVKQGEEAGKHRAEAQKEIGNSQLALSHSGASLDRMAGIVKNPVFQNMRNKIPFFQDKQLGWIEKTGTPEEKKLIGDFITTGEQIIASGVQAFGGKPLVREFDLLQRQKINRNDPVHVAEGKLRASIALHDIAEQKNDIISNLLQQGVSEADAVKQANKMVDVSAIEKQTDDLLRDKPTEEDIAYMAKKRGISANEVKKLLKAKGLY